jgi:hypothetical protein
MRVALALIALLATSGPVLADNPYAAAGISDPAHVTQFLARLKQAVAASWAPSSSWPECFEWFFRTPYRLGRSRG